MVKEYQGSDLKLKNVSIQNSYVLECQPYEYFFFQIPKEEYKGLTSIELELTLESDMAYLVLNEYLPGEAVVVRNSGSVSFAAGVCECGENILAYKGQIEIKSIRFIGGADEVPYELERGEQSLDLVYAAAGYLLKSRICFPEHSQFRGSCYAIYDYTNECHRMSCWLWSDAPVVSALLKLSKRTEDRALAAHYRRLASDIGEVFLKSQITEPEDEVCGALISRYRYYGTSRRSFHKLMGLNDTSYSVNWALMPLYEETGDVRYLEASRLALDWIKDCIYRMDFLPSHFYYEDKYWEDRAFVDTGFCAEGFERYQNMAGDRDYTDTIDFLMRRFIGQFKLASGYFGQNYNPRTGVDDRLFTRGHAWVLEGLLACYRVTKNMYYREEIKEICKKLVKYQNENGSWSYLLGFGIPEPGIMEGSGVCEKATAILAYLFLKCDEILPDETIRAAARRAIDWCEVNMVLEKGDGFGGIASKSLSSGITGLPFLLVATGYANAYYIMAKLESI